MANFGWKNEERARVAIVTLMTMMMFRLAMKVEVVEVMH